MPAVLPDHDPRTTLQDDGPRASHLVPPRGGRDGAARALEARVLGAPVTTLCGLLLVPTRDGRSFPLCPACHEEFRLQTGHTEGWRDA